ncbi:MAG: undecaprenyldiphospho-muramoylpentapeptide beta-N-acetylglucosaminyltransferase [Burkholderiales bacterium]|nr:undecaprenyldiphospho-muramoylpentapeptide beta-N-acetylglucosaminyltransferase [Burkholderiales bacterium]
MAGGTGGHVFPALAVAERLVEGGCRVLWLGSRAGMEAQLVPRHGYEMAWVRFGGVRGKGLMSTLLLPARLLLAFAQAFAIMLRERPAAVIGFGGYISFPGGMMAVLLGRRLLLHEQNAVAGLANRVLARLADRVLAAFPDVLPGARWTGNPVRPEIARIADPQERYPARRGPLRLLVVGGSLGAQSLNDLLPRALALLPAADRPTVVHQSGRGRLDPLRAGYAAAGVAASVVEFIEDMAAEYAQADLVVCRAGATTIAEIACAGVASILVPYPFAVDDHQTANARFLADAGAALLMPQGALDAAKLAAALASLDRGACMAMALRARERARADAAQAVAQECISMAERA